MPYFLNPHSGCTVDNHTESLHRPGFPGRARGRKAPRPRRLRRNLAWISGGLLLAILLSGCYVYQHLSSNLTGIDLDKRLGGDRPAGPDNGSQNILVLGSDSRAGKNGELAGGKTGGSARSDTAMVVHLYPGGKKAAAVSIPRDTLVTRPACTTDSGEKRPAANRAMFNSAFSTGGPACTVKTVESMTGMRMDHYLQVDFAGFKELVDAMGGVPITVGHAIEDRSSGLSLDAGTHRLDGDEALAFVRTRHGVGDGSDPGRIKLQQKFLLSALTEAKHSGTPASPKMYRVADKATKALTTDSHLASLPSLAKLTKQLSGIPDDGMKTVTLPATADTADPNRLVAEQPQATHLWDALRRDEPVPAQR